MDDSLIHHLNDIQYQGLSSEEGHRADNKAKKFIQKE